MNKKLPPLNALKAFESAARHLNFTKAAEDLFVTQAAVSHQIKLLEDFLGISLFHRRNRLLELTELGAQYFYEVQPLLEQIALATDKVRQQSSRQILTIRVPQTFGMHWLVPRLADFHEKYPEVEVRIKGVDQDEGLLGKETDVAIYYGKGDWQDLESIRLTESRIVILASPEYLSKNRVYSAEDLVGKTLLHSSTYNKWKRMVEHLNIEDKVDAETGSIFSHTFMVLQAAMHQQGIAISNQILAQHEIDKGALIEPFLTTLFDEKSFYVVYPPQSVQVPKVKCFVEWIQQKMKERCA
ncbi:transcriptional regulator GcvA [Mannheimia varigena]|uniref:transcriptional regulator GcvA n=1 Tax=Mannheimia varigena TaxID=85404 RepID=UPI001105F7BA|nr:transcriptional regulator GcvA [Mannheimia varigena]TLU75599.1 transcriptional regulator GcvA [Mannheimia varigena]